MAATALHAEYIVTFRSEEEMEKALEPLTVQDVRKRLEMSKIRETLKFQIDNALSSEKKIPLRNKPVGNLLKTPLWKTQALTVYYPEKPRVPHQLTIALNRKDIKNLASIQPEESREIFATIKKISEIYKSLFIRDFVVAQYDCPKQEFGHVVKIIPQMPGYNDIKNIVDKVDCNRYVLFPDANLSTVKYTLKFDEVEEHIRFWQSAFKRDYPPLCAADTKIEYPFSRKEAHHEEADKILLHHLLEMLQDGGAQVENLPPFECVMPIRAVNVTLTPPAQNCPFCNASIIQGQLIYAYEDVVVLYNVRKGAKPGCSFLVLPKRHTEKIYGLSLSEVDHIAILQKALAEVLKETHSFCEVVCFTQDGPTVGQSVYHTHVQVVAIDPKTVALTWTLMSLSPNEKVSEEEMRDVCQEFGLKLQQKLQELHELKEAV